MNDRVQAFICGFMAVKFITYKPEQKNYQLTEDEVTEELERWEKRLSL